jgi:quinol-cytochrome oxidoreductase complex cytochrome b subunit
MLGDSALNLARSRFRAAIILAVTVDTLQIVAFPFLAEGAVSPLDDILDFVTAAVLVRLLGWHWEFLPSLLAELVPGVDLIPFWTLAVANVYRKWKQAEAGGHEIQVQPLALR